MSATLPVQVGTVPAGACPADYQAIANLLASVYSVTLPDAYTSVQVSAVKPSDTTKPWLQLDSLGRPSRVYVFAQGLWLSLHPIAPSFVMIWPDALPDFTTFDGGDASPDSPISGPMWKQLTTINGRVPLGAGALPTSGTIVNFGNTGGEETHLLKSGESGVAAHTHDLVSYSLISGSNFNSGGNNDRGGGVTAGVTGGAKDATTPHNNLQPYLGVYFLQRTQRLFYSVSP